jgi:hypothetical protein
VNQNKLTNYNYYTYMLPSTNVSLPGLHACMSDVVAAAHLSPHTHTHSHAPPHTHHRTRTGSGFLVPDGNIGILPNQIGVLTDQWLGAYQCNQALGLKTMVQTANPYPPPRDIAFSLSHFVFTARRDLRRYDQFAAFRSSSLEAENPTSGCLLRSNASNANPFSTSPLLQVLHPPTLIGITYPSSNTKSCVVCVVCRVSCIVYRVSCVVCRVSCVVCRVV